MKDEFLATDVDRVAGIMAALEACDEREPGRQKVDDLPFALVSPLRAEHCDVHDRHPCYYTGRAPNAQCTMHDAQGERRILTRSSRRGSPPGTEVAAPR